MREKLSVTLPKLIHDRLSEDEVVLFSQKGLFPVPKLITKNLRREKIAEPDEVDVIKVLGPLLDCDVLVGTLRGLDVLNGCRHQCETCYSDAPVPDKRFSFESLRSLFGDKRFIASLQPDFLRFGISGDILNHPKGVEIIRLAVESTQELDNALTQKSGKKHLVQVFTNFRKENELNLLRMISLAREFEERMRLVISLPLNSSKQIQKDFLEFERDHPHIFEVNLEGDKCIMGENVGVQDLSGIFSTRLGGLSHQGRMSEKVKRLEKETSSVLASKKVGHVKTYLNPDNLWLAIYAERKDSYTEKIYVPITKRNIDLLDKLPYSLHLPSPPNWKHKLKTN